MSKILVYVHDPMCSWCWGFEPTRHAIVAGLPADTRVWRLLGGLAPDSEQPMPEPMRAALQQTWRRIEEMIPGTRFNFDFWTNNTPRRSTYPANRAVIAARLQGEACDSKMTGAIQRAYYLEARNPSDDSTLASRATWRRNRPMRRCTRKSTVRAPWASTAFPASRCCATGRYAISASITTTPRPCCGKSRPPDAASQAGGG